MDNGSSRELLELWAPDPRNAVIVTGYSVEGTMARASVSRPFRGYFLNFKTGYSKQS